MNGSGESRGRSPSLRGTLKQSTELRPGFESCPPSRYGCGNHLPKAPPVPGRLLTQVGRAKNPFPRPLSSCSKAGRTNHHNCSARSSPRTCPCFSKTGRKTCAAKRRFCRMSGPNFPARCRFFFSTGFAPVTDTNRAFAHRPPPPCGLGRTNFLSQSRGFLDRGNC